MSPSNASDPPANRFTDAPYYGQRGGSYRDTAAKGYGDDDGNDDTFVYDDDDVDEDDIESYSGKDGIMHTSSAIKPKKKPCCSFRCKLCVCFLFVVVIVVVVAATVAQYNQAKAAYVHSQYATLPDAPQELAGWCSTTDEASEDYNSCLLWCHPADCCTVPSDYGEPGVSCLDPTNPTVDSICDDYRSACSLLGQHAGDDGGSTTNYDAANSNGNGDDGGANNQQDNANSAANQDGIDNLDGTADSAGNTDGTGNTGGTDDTNGGNSSSGGNL
jgi:hypothetical protein